MSCRRDVWQTQLEGIQSRRVEQSAQISEDVKVHGDIGATEFADGRKGAI